jgi:hypothetical protein
MYIRRSTSMIFEQYRGRKLIIGATRKAFFVYTFLRISRIISAASGKPTKASLSYRS